MSEEKFDSLMKQLAAGDRQALKEIYQEYMKLIYSVCLSMLHQKEAAEDVSSEFFIKLMKSAGTFDGRGHHKTWLVTIAKRLCIDYLRKNSQETVSLDAPIAGTGTAGGTHSTDSTQGESGNSLLDSVPDKANVEETAVNKFSLEAAMKLLTDKEKEIVNMKIAGGMKFKEIAEYLGLPQGTVSWHYNEAIKKMRRYLL
ncbi:MAG: sigma-70 family RNA polymerase sigma factor [Eubacterium sp.]|nr:sigma-70 family RNA polymerase sigma factor [Eubacterium sp.]SEG20838.1 RNA polymerase sigma-70 factor, ECF subfamily [Eubacterium ruminantium]